MNYHAILFSTEMVQATKDGRKTQTRRVIKPQPGSNAEYAYQVDVDRYLTIAGLNTGGPITKLVNCPYGVPGDRLWVREEHYRYGHWEPVIGLRTKTGREKWKFVQDSEELLYQPPAGISRGGRHHKDPYTPAWHKRLARFMPRWASRITLEVVRIRVERVQDITENDAVAEGAHHITVGNNLSPYMPWDIRPPQGYRAGFRNLWNSINASSYPWENNPWVWVIEFKKL